MAKTTIYIALTIGAQQPAYPAYIVFRSPYRFSDGKTITLPEPDPIALAQDGTAVISVEPGVWLVDEVLPTQVFRRAVLVPESATVVRYAELLEVTNPVEIGYGPTWAATALAAAGDARVSADSASDALGGSLAAKKQMEDLLASVPDESTALALAFATDGPARQELLRSVGIAVTSELSKQPTIVAAAAQAVSAQGAVRDIFARRAGGTPDPATGMTVVRNGPPTFGTPAKQGGGSLVGPAMLHVPFPLPDGATRTVEFFFRVDDTVAIPRTFNLFALGSLSNQVASFYANVKTDGTTVFTASNRTGPAVKDGAFHHLAMIVSRSGTNRSLTGLFLDGAAIAGSGPVNRSDETDILQIGGLWFTNTFDWYSGARIDQLRISDGPRYTAAFTPPTTIDSDANTIAMYSMDPAVAGSIAWPARPAGIEAGLVRWRGPRDFPAPTNMQTLDTWTKEPLDSAGWTK